MHDMVESSSRPKMTVAITDDSAAVRSHLTEQLSGMDDITLVGAAKTLSDARRLIEETCPDVVVLDIQLPDGSGIDMLRQLKRERKAIDIIMLTNHANDLYRRACYRAGAKHFFDKSSEFGRVAEVLATMAAERRQDQA